MMGFDGVCNKAMKFLDPNQDFMECHTMSLVGFISIAQHNLYFFMG